uniref:Uncharacterized protein n=1 Tax=Panagrolaimus superbus TaxID=310955 RepID=A0A914Z0S3_9BILA
MEESATNFLSLIFSGSTTTFLLSIIFLASFLFQCTKQKYPPTSRTSRKVPIDIATANSGGGGYAGQLKSSNSKETTSGEDGTAGTGAGAGKKKSKEDATTTTSPPKKKKGGSSKRVKNGSNRVRNNNQQQQSKDADTLAAAAAQINKHHSPQHQPQQQSQPESNPDIAQNPSGGMEYDISFATTSMVPANTQKKSNYKRYGGGGIDQTQMGGIDDDNTESTDLRTPNWMKTPTYFRQKAEADKILDQKIH